MDRETEKKIFDFKLFLQDDFLNLDIFNEQYFSKLVSMFNCESVFLDDTM